MMKQHNKASLFLMELIIAILFFSISSAICIEVFVKSQTINTETENQMHAAMTASYIAEAYRSQSLERYYQTDQEGYVYFNKDWETTVASQYTYKALLAKKDDTLTITILYKDKALYTINCMHYQQRNVIS